MDIEVILPKQDIQMESGTILQWLKEEGDAVQQEEPLYVMETDKTTVEVAAPAAGVLASILRKEGETVPVGEVVALIRTAAAAAPKGAAEE